MGLLEAIRRAPAWVRWLLVLLPLRIGLIPLIPLLPEEAYHWNFARHLDWGYYDHPPMIAWAIAGGRWIFGDTLFGVRAVPLMFSVGTTILLARMAARLYGEAAAVWSVILFTFQPVALPVSEAGFPDSPLLFFWMLAMSLAWEAIQGQDGRRWLGAGAALGGAMLSKYTAVLLVPSVFIYLLLSSRHRRWLGTPWPYLAGMVALAVFSPVIYWNWRHDWASFLYQSEGRIRESRGFDPHTALRFVWTQVLAVFPMTFALAAAAILRLVRSTRPEEKFLLACVLPILLLFFGISWIRPAHILWPLPGYLSLVLAMSAVAAEAGETIGRFYSRARTVLVVLSLVGLIAGGIHLRFFLPWVSPLQGPYGWKEVAERARVFRAQLADSAFYLGLGRKYTCTSQLAFHLNRPDEVHGANLIGEGALQYGYWCDPKTLAGRDAVVVIEGDLRATNVLAILKGYFESLEPAGEVSVRTGRSPLLPQPSLVFTLYKARGYRPPKKK